MFKVAMETATCHTFSSSKSNLVDSLVTVWILTRNIKKETLRRLLSFFYFLILLHAQESRGGFSLFLQEQPISFGHFRAAVKEVLWLACKCFVPLILKKTTNRVTRSFRRSTNAMHRHTSFTSTALCLYIILKCSAALRPVQNLWRPVGQLKGFRASKK